MNPRVGHMPDDPVQEMYERGKRKLLAEAEAEAASRCVAEAAGSVRQQALADAAMLGQIMYRAMIQDEVCRTCGRYDPDADLAAVMDGAACWGQWARWQEHPPSMRELRECWRQQAPAGEPRGDLQGART